MLGLLAGVEPLQRFVKCLRLELLAFVLVCNLSDGFDTAFGSNLTDDRYVIGGTPLVDNTATAATIYNVPRTYGIEAAYTW